MPTNKLKKVLTISHNDRELTFYTNLPSSLEGRLFARWEEEMFYPSHFHGEFETCGVFEKYYLYFDYLRSRGVIVEVEDTDI